MVHLLALAGTHPMTLHKAVDGPIRGTAYQYLAPKGWKVETKLSWTDATLQPAVLTTRAESPEGRFGHSFVPGVDFPLGGVAGGAGAMHPISNRTNGVQPPERGTDWLLQGVRTDETISDVEAVSRQDEPIPPDRLERLRHGNCVLGDDADGPPAGWTALSKAH